MSNGTRISVILCLCSVAAPSWRIGSLTPSALAQPMAITDLRELARESTAIIAGRVSDINEQETMEKGSSKFHYTIPKIADVRVYSVLKGEINAEDVEIEYGEGHSTNGVYPNEYWLRKNEYALFFLKRSHSGKYEFADSNTGAIPVTSVEVPSTEAARTAEAKVELYLFASLSDPDQKLAESALRWIDTLTYLTKSRMKGASDHAEQTPIIMLQQLASSPDPEVQGLAYAALIKMGDRPILTRAARFAERPTKNPRAQYWKSRIIAAIGKK